MRRVHRLESEAVLRAVEVGIGDEVLDGLEHLLQEGTLDETGLKHRHEWGESVGGRVGAGGTIAGACACERK